MLLQLQSPKIVNCVPLFNKKKHSRTNRKQVETKNIRHYMQIYVADIETRFESKQIERHTPNGSLYQLMNNLTCHLWGKNPPFMEQL